MFAIEKSFWKGAALACALGGAVGIVAAQTSPPSKSQMQLAKKQLARIPAQFIENKGQWDRRAQFYGKGSNTDVWVTRDGFVFDYFRNMASNGVHGRSGHVVGLSFVGSDPAAPTLTEDPTGSVRDYLSKGRHQVRGAHGYRTLLTRNFYRGIDLKRYLDGNKRSYDFIVAPGADPKQIRFQLKGVDKARVDAKGDLVYSTSMGEKKQSGLFAYQLVAGKKKPVSVAFAMTKATSGCFKLGAYDHSKPLVIDPDPDQPGLVYGTYYGGDEGPDEVRAIATDAQGGVYLVGQTQSARFPAIYGPYGFTLRGGWDAFVSKLQGDAYNHDYAALVGGAGDDIATKVSVDPFGNVWVAGYTDSADFPVGARSCTYYLRQRVPDSPHYTNTQGTPWYLARDNKGYRFDPFDINGGEYRLTVSSSWGGGTTQPLKWNATAAQVQAAIAATGVVTSADVRVSGTLPATDSNDVGYQITFTPGLHVDVSVDEDLHWNGIHTIVSEGLRPYVVVFDTMPQPQYVQTIKRVGSVAQNGAWYSPVDELPPVVQNNNDLTGWLISYGSSKATAPLSVDASALEVQKVIEGLGAGEGNVIVTGSSLNSTGFVVTFNAAKITQQNLKALSVRSLFQQDRHYTIDRIQSIFLMRFKQSNTTVLDPTDNGVTVGRYFDGPDWKQLASMAIVPNNNPTPGDSVRISIAGDSWRPGEFGDWLAGMNDVPGPATNRGWFITTDFKNGAFTNVPALCQYVGDNAWAELTGMAVDPEGSIYVAGSVYASGNSDTAVDPNPVFRTTAGVFDGGRLSRYEDMFVRKYNKDGQIQYSALIGGNDWDLAGGAIFKRDYVSYVAPREVVGNSIAVDQLGNAYIVGTTRSFNYPRTRNTYGDEFTGNTNQVVVTKVNSDASQLVYSTNIRTSGGWVAPVGITVDTTGQAYITGMLGTEMNFWTPASAPDPVQPGSASQPGDIQVLKMKQGASTEVFKYDYDDRVIRDKVDGTYKQDFTAPPDIDSYDGFLFVLNPSATGREYATYLGGKLDDFVYSPYVDRFGDMWIMGMNEQWRRFSRVSSTGAVTQYMDTGPLSVRHISVKAFKASTEWLNDGGVINYQPTFAYGVNSRMTPGWEPVNPMFITVGNRTDGFAMKFRLSAPVISGISLSAANVPGGDPLESGNPPYVTATVNLTNPAPSGGIIVKLSLNNAAASFSPADALSATDVSIDAGQSSGSVKIYSRAVAQNTSVQIKADYEGAYQIVNLVVVPWLQSLGLSPNSVVGGNQVVAKITIAQPAPTGGVPVTLSTTPSNPALVVLPQGAVMIPAGQTTASFPLATVGVTNNANVSISATILGLGMSQNLTLTPAGVSTVVFNPQRIARGGTSTGTVNLNGVAGGPFNVYLHIDGDARGYTINGADASAGDVTLPIAKGATSATFTIKTPVVPADSTETANTQRRVVASRPAQGGFPDSSTAGTLFIDGVTLNSLTLTPSTVDGGASATGKISLTSPAPAGGVTIYFFSSNGTVAKIPGWQAVIPEGKTEATFTVNTTVVPTQTSVVLTAALASTAPTDNRIPRLQTTLTVKGVTVNSLTVSPGSVVGGAQNATGTVTISNTAPASGITVTLKSDDASVKVPATVVIAGSNKATFPVTTYSVDTAKVVGLHASIGAGTSADTTITVRPVGVATISFSPKTVRSTAQTVCTVTLDAPAAKAGQLTFTVANSNLLLGLNTVNVAAGQQTIQVRVTAARVARNVSTSVKATFNGTSASTTVNVIR